MDPQLRALARKVNALEKQQLASKQPSLAYSTIDDGAITAVDADGNLTMAVGSQHDGTNTAASLTGPTPPTPLAPFLSDEMPGGLLVNWDGTFEDPDTVAPLDFTRVTAHAVTVAEGLTNFDPLIAHPPKGSLSSATGGEVFIVSERGVEMLVVLVAWTESGKFSAHSEPSLGMAREVGLNTSDPEWIAMQDEIDAVSGVANTAQSEAELARQEAAAAATTANDAGDTAAAAQTTANDAKTTADSASAEAAEAVGIASDKAIVRIQSTTPVAADQNANTLWIDMTGGSNTPKRWDGAAWVAVTDDVAVQAAADAASAASAASAAQADATQALADAQAAADAANDAGATATAAQESADGKSTIFHATYPPSDEPNEVGDVWWFRDATTGNIKGLYQGLGGTLWEGHVLDNQIIANLDAGKVTFGTMSGERIQVGTLVISQMDGLQTTLDDKASLAEAQAKADAAETAAVTTAATDAASTYGETKDLVSNWRTTGTTTIKGGMLENDSILTASLAAGAVVAEKVGADVLISNEVFSREGYFGEVEAGQITAGDLAAAIAVLGSLSVGTAITIDPENGIVIRGPQGNTTLPADGSEISLSGDVTALSMTVLGQLGIRGVTNEISKAAIVRLATGTTAPQSAPSVTVDHASKTIHEGFEPRGFARFSDERFLSVESLGDATLTRTIEGTNFDHAAESFSMVNNGGRSEVTSGLGGAVIVGNVVYVLCQTTEAVPGTYLSRWYVYKWTWNGGGSYSFNTRWLYEPTSYLGGNSTYRPAIGYDSTSGEILIAQAGGTGGNGHVSRYSTNGVFNSRQNLQDSSGVNLAIAKHCTGVLGGSFDFGSWRLVTTWENLNHAKVFNSLEAEAPLDQFAVPSSDTRGIYWDGSRFRTRAPAKVYDHTSIRTGSSSLSVATTWRKADGTGPDYAQYETAISPIKTLSNFPDRSRLLVSTAPIPDDSADPNDADSISVYLSTTFSPSSGDFSRAATPAVGVREVALSTIPAGGVPPASNTFPGATPAAIQSGLEDANGPLLELRGDGYGRISDFESDAVNVSGRVTSDELDVGGGKVIRGMDYGLSNGSSDANGHHVVNHGLGVVPETIIVTGGSTQPRAYYLHAKTATNFTVQVRAIADGSNVTNNANISVAWFALA